MSVDKPIYVVANYSGGKDSTAMTLGWIQNLQGAVLAIRYINQHKEQKWIMKETR